MLAAKTIMPVVLVSIAAILALTFLLTHFASEFTTDASFEVNPLLRKEYYDGQPLALATKGVCVFANNHQHIDCANADGFCRATMGLSVDTPASVSASTCTAAFITCELPCGVSGGGCGDKSFGGVFKQKRC